MDGKARSSSNMETAATIICQPAPRARHDRPACPQRQPGDGNPGLEAAGGPAVAPRGPRPLLRGFWPAGWSTCAAFRGPWVFGGALRCTQASGRSLQSPGWQAALRPAGRAELQAAQEALGLRAQLFSGVRMAEWSKAPDSSLVFLTWRVLVSSWRRGFESHF